MAHSRELAPNPTWMAPNSVGRVLLEQELRQRRVDGALVILFNRRHALDDRAIRSATFEYRVERKLVARDLPVTRIVLKRVTFRTGFDHVSLSAGAHTIATLAIGEGVVGELYLVIAVEETGALDMITDIREVIAIINEGW